MIACTEALTLNRAISFCKHTPLLRSINYVLVGYFSRCPGGGGGGGDP